MLSTATEGAVLEVRYRRGDQEKAVTVTLVAPAGRWLLGAREVLDTGGHIAPIRSIAFTRNGQQLVSAGEDKTVRVWDIGTGKTVHIIRIAGANTLNGKIYAMALSPDERWLAVAGWMLTPGLGLQHNIRLFDFASGKLIALFSGHKSLIETLAFAPGGKRLISGSLDSTAIVWDIAKRAPMHTLSGHSGPIYAIPSQNLT